MNTQGWIRGLIARNSPLDKFVVFVSNTISKEFEFRLRLIIEDNTCIFFFDDYRISVSKEKLNVLKKTSPYSMDKFILENLKILGFDFDLHRSQYIEYCYGLVGKKTVEFSIIVSS